MSVLPNRRPKSSRSLIGRLFRWLFALTFVATCSAGLLWFFANIEGPLAKAKVVNIPKGSSTIDIANRLNEQGVVDSSIMTILGITAVRYTFDVDPKAGEYEFAAGSSLIDVLRKIKTGRTLFYKVSMPEGFTSWQVMERLKANDVLVGEIEKPPSEGELLPDTYLFTRGSTRQSIIDQMNTAQNKFIEKKWPARAEGLPFKTPEEALILASIVEKETGQADERAQVAAVFVNRLRRGMRLQSDPTIIYGITRGQGKLDRPIRRSDIREKTDYNTYQIDGLPPTPIANPGRASIEAVLNPVETKHLYFVADGTGGHVFAKTLPEHNANVKKWRSWLRDKREQQEAEQQTATGEAEQQAAVEEEPPAPSESQASESSAASVPVPAQSDGAQQRSGNFRVVEVAGRSVPIPKSKPQRQ
ncbi:endolytic transglycosylase MltG [Anderseniella sp. Alg231-50]|uniref:endolytic transglycosylase MltG n=1 Tax=Anderseniella sp. Alg231-50 TaxID=1922226 RepID=UPI000D55793E